MFVRPPYSEVDASPAAGLKTTKHLRLPKLADGTEPASLPPDDDARVAQLRSFCVLDSNKDPRFDRITRLTSELLDVPIVLVSLVDTSREWFKSWCAGLHFPSILKSENRLALGLGRVKRSRDPTISRCHARVLGRAALT